MLSILRGASSLILATADFNFPRRRENSIFSLAYLELYAPTLGLGSCWGGMFERIAMKDNSPLIKLFNIPNNKNPRPPVSSYLSQIQIIVGFMVETNVTFKIHFFYNYNYLFLKNSGFLELIPIPNP